VRGNLSDKKKIKDLFLVVIRSVEINKNKVLISSLIQFISNLCYGTGKLKMMLAKENTTDFMATLKEVLDQVNTELKQEDDTEAEELDDDKAKLEEIFKEAERKMAFVKQDAGERSLLKITLYTLVANLCNEKSLRQTFASDSGGILTQIINDFKKDVKNTHFDWLEVVNRQLAVFINVATFEEAGQQALME
jgi:hypothetical protein